MKKIFTLASMALVAMSMNAQTVEVWDASSIKDLSSGKFNIVQADQITMEDNTSENVIIHDQNDVLPYPGEGMETDPNTITNTSTTKLKNAEIKAKTENIEMSFRMTPNSGDEDQAFTYALGYNPESEPGNNALNTDIFSTKFLDRIKPKSGNAFLKHVEWWEYNSDGDVSHKTYDEVWSLDEKTAPAVSANITLTAKCDGKINVGIYQNGNHLSQPVYVLDVNEDETYTALAPSELNYLGYLNNNTVEPIVDGHPGDDYIIAPDDSGTKGFLGYLSFNMKAGKKYMIFLVQQQIHLYGFEFTPSSETGISEITATNDANAPVYNLAGQRVSNDAKGLLIKDGKKFINK